ncbi:LysM peptidoglycan-binding domain-containing protein [Candidatus Solirubrobacter pratensis]|uniref:LysM peptidoglycan-binding domain-containing protein n=1 Tax=Candidatus Solirubrobacter pratensis TaxID=1298857 RepID=UPI00041E496C|nr:LysM peptidoglycan-binding domain-containing protein [Candidatus Solirubrobacter pratensis]
MFAVLALIPSTAGAAVPHVVQPGESLWSIAAANNLTTRTVAAYNGLSESSPVVLGSTIQIPSTAEGYASLQKAGLVAAAPLQSAAAPAPAAASSTSAAPAAQGAYTVRPGDTLSGLAAGARVPVSAMAAINGLDPNGVLLAGTVIKLPAGAPAPARASQPTPVATVVPSAAPEPTPSRVDASSIQSAAAAGGVSPSLAAAIGWQESGFNNAMVSGANARGVMQITPGTWAFVQNNLAGRRLDPNSAADNVSAGVLYLKHLIQQTGDESTAIACYYQGCGSVRSRGLFDDTKRYVANVQALRARFGGS